MSEVAQPERRVVSVNTQLPQDYHDERLRAWEHNSRFWAEYVDSDARRFMMLDDLAQRVGTIVRSFGSQPKIIDFGCGEGQFLRLCHRRIHNAKLTGIDFCCSMLAIAKERSNLIPIKFVHGDIERDLKLEPENHLAVAILSLDEVDSLNTPISNIAASLRPGGMAAIVILDSVFEWYRHRGHIPKGARSDDTLLILKHICIDQKISPSPYSRVIRSVGHFFRLAARHDLEPDEYYDWPQNPEFDRVSEEPIFNVMFFRKTMSQVEELRNE